jgi:acyl-CoA synthetase (AMP-forming)/AMP-acid ligase II
MPRASSVSDARSPTPGPRPPPPAIVNVGLRLSVTAATNPHGIAVAMPRGHDAADKRIYQSVTFRELEDDSNLLADGLAAMGVRPGMRLVLMVPPSIDFISLVFAMFKAGVVTVLIDPGMGRRNLIRCLTESEPEGFIGIPLAQAVRAVLRGRFPKAKYNVTVGRRWFWGGRTIAQLRARRLHEGFQPIAPKGVLYRHGNFDRQATEIRDFYGIQPGEIDLPGFPLFALFNCAMGVTTVIPDMDPTRPARVDPRKIIEAVNDWRVTQAFGSPALWNVVGRYCEEHQIVLPTLKRVLSAGAPVPQHVMRRMKAAIAADGDVHTPYGATEALPVASISASEVLSDMGQKSLSAENMGSQGCLPYGRGTCVGRHFPGIEWRVIRITDEPIATIGDAEELPSGEIGELIVRGPVVTTEYVTQTDCNPLHKIRDGEMFWHRMGDVGYLDQVGQTFLSVIQNPSNFAADKNVCPTTEQFWFCGRKSHRVITASGMLFTIPCEAIFNQHPWVYRSALVGAGPRGQHRPVVFVEPWPEHRLKVGQNFKEFEDELRRLASQHSHTADIRDFFWMPVLPVDIRHNAKIFREKLAVAAEQMLSTRRSSGA